MSAGPLHLVSDFNIDLLAAGLRATIGDARAITASPFGQVYQTLIAPNSNQISRGYPNFIDLRPHVIGIRRQILCLVWGICG